MNRIDAQNTEVDNNNLIALATVTSAPASKAAITIDEKPIVGGGCLGGGIAEEVVPSIRDFLDEDWHVMMRKSLAKKSAKAKEVAEKAAAEAVAAVHWGHLVTSVQMDALVKAAAKAADAKTSSLLRSLALKVAKAADVKAATTTSFLLRKLALKVIKAADVKAAKREQKKEKDEAAKAKAKLMRLAHVAYGKVMEERATDAKENKLKVAEERAALAIIAAEKAAEEAEEAQKAVRALVADGDDEEEAVDESLVVIGKAMKVHDKENTTPEEAERLAVVEAAEEELDWSCEDSSSEEEEEDEEWA